MKPYITPSLLNNWQFYLSVIDGEFTSKVLDQDDLIEEKREEFLFALLRKPLQDTEAIINGRKFEDEIKEGLFNNVTSSRKNVNEIVNLLKPANRILWQVPLTKELYTTKGNVILKGICDGIVLDDNVIFDIKYQAKAKEIGHYYSSVQHLIYLYCRGNDHNQNEKLGFEYIIGSGYDDWTCESYNLSPKQCENELQHIVQSFFEFLALPQNKDLSDAYYDVFCVKYNNK
jgi:hypothetical protein